MIKALKQPVSLFFILVFLSSLPAGCQHASSGSLVIGGGGLKDETASVFEQYIALAGGKENASFAVIPSASGEARNAFEEIKSTLVLYGVAAENVHLIPIAMVDDEDTPDVDESEWKENGNDPELESLVRQCSGIWFSGGDQNRTTAILYNADGSRTRVLDAVWDVYNRGGVIGGTSAGAAIMSEVMIGGGNSLGALTYGVKTALVEGDFPESEGVLVTRGLGFFPLGVVDQHFGQRSRIGRLAVAMLYSDRKSELGFGVDENTALIYEGSTGICRAAGKGGITLLNASDAVAKRVDGAISVQNLRISRLENGDVFDPVTGEVIPAPGKEPRAGNEYYDNAAPGQGGILSGYSADLLGLLTANLMDNKAAGSVSNISLRDDRSGFLLTFTKETGSSAWYTDEPDGYDHYTVVNVRMDITPVDVSVSPK